MARARGGKRPGAGRKPKQKLSPPPRDIAREVLVEINKTPRTEVKRWLELLESNDQDRVLRVLMYLTDRVEGKPVQKQEDKVLFDPNEPLRVVIEHIGNNK